MLFNSHHPEISNPNQSRPPSYCSTIWDANHCHAQCTHWTQFIQSDDFHKMSSDDNDVCRSWKIKVHKKLSDGADWNCKKGTKFVKLSARPLTYLVEGHQNYFATSEVKLALAASRHQEYCLGKHLAPLLANVSRPRQKLLTPCSPTSPPKTRITWTWR